MVCCTLHSASCPLVCQFRCLVSVVPLWSLWNICSSIVPLLRVFCPGFSPLCSVSFLCALLFFVVMPFSVSALMSYVLPLVFLFISLMSANSLFGIPVMILVSVMFSLLLCPSLLRCVRLSGFISRCFSNVLSPAIGNVTSIVNGALVVLLRLLLLVSSLFVCNFSSFRLCSCGLWLLS